METVSTYINNIAHSYASSYREVDWEDVRQVLWLDYLEQKDSDSARLEDYEDGQVLRLLMNAATDYCEGEVAHVYGLEEDRFYYSRRMIKELIPFVLSPEHWSNLAALGERGEGHSNNDPAHTGDGLATYADLRQGWAALSDRERAILGSRYLEPEPVPYEAIADLLGEEEPTVRMWASRAVGRMQRAMGGRKPAPRHQRHAVTNAAAQSITSHNYSGE